MILYVLILLAIVGIAVGAYFLFFKAKKDSSITLRAVSSVMRGEDVPADTTEPSEPVVEPVPAIPGISSVTIEFRSIELQPAEGDRIVFNETASVDLVTLDANTLISGKEVPAGKYEWIRLVVSGDTTKTFVTLDGVNQKLTIPSGTTSGLKLTKGFVVPENSPANFSIVFDVDKSLRKTSTGFRMNPTLKLVDNSVPDVTDTPDETV